MGRPPAPEAVRQKLLAALTEGSDAMTTAELRRCLSATFGRDVVHERIYRNLEVLEKRGEVTRTSPGGRRHTLWRLSTAQADRHHMGRRY